MTVLLRDPFSELVDERRRLRPEWYTWLEEVATALNSASVSVSDFVGDSGSGGTAGLVPAPAAGDAAANKYLHAGGSWATVTGFQPLDSDLTAIAALTTTSFGRGLLELADTAALTADVDDFVGDSGSGGTAGLVPAPSAGDAAADKFLHAGGLWTAITGFQPVDSDLTAIAALTTTSFGRGLLELANSAALTADIDDFVGDSGSGGTSGAVPAPSAGDAAALKYLSASGAWATVASSTVDYVSPEDFGAAGDGVTDDTSAMASFFGNSRKRGKLTAGATYLISSDTITIPADSEWEGPRSAMILNADGTGKTLEISEADNVILRGFTVDGGNPNNTVAAGYDDTHSAIFVVGTSSSVYLDNLTLDDLAIQNCGYTGIEFRYVKNSRITNCYVTRIGYAGLGLWSITNCLVDSNIVESVYPGESAGTAGSNCYGIAIGRFSSDPISNRVWISRNYVTDVTWEGIDEHDAQDVWITDNDIYYCGSGIAVEHHVSGAYAFNINVTGNSIYGYGESVTKESVTYPSIVGIGCNGALTNDSQGFNLTICNNRIENIGDTRSSSSDSGAIRVFNFRGITVNNNVIYFCYKYGIILTNTSTDSVFIGTVNGNSIEETQTWDSVASDILLRDRVAVLVQGNIMAGNGDGASQPSVTYTSSIANNYLYS